MKQAGNNLNNLLNTNRAVILQYIAQHYSCSRKEIADATGLTQAAITKILHPLVDSGIVFETGFTEGKLGRRSVGLSLQYNKYFVIGATLGWEHMHVGIFDFSGKSCGQVTSISYPYMTIHDIDRIVDLMIDAIKNAMVSYPNIIAVGISVPGPYYRDEGRFIITPYDKSNPLSYSIKEKVLSRIHLPIFIEHDADAGALGYWWFELKANKRISLLHIIASSGIGGGILSNGRIFHTGPENASTEIGHVTIDYQGRKCMCGSTGCMNAYCCTKALEQEACERLAENPDSLLNKYTAFNIDTIIQAAKDGDNFSIELIRECGHYMGHGLVSLLHIFNPNIIVISGRLARAGRLYLDAVHESLEARSAIFTASPEVRLYDSDTTLSTLGGAALAIKNVLDDPASYLRIDSAEN